MGTRGVVLGLLAVAFLGRVLGQLAAALLEPVWLPPMEEWHSGLIPYPLLLLSQLAILALQARISWDLCRGAGFFAVRRPGFGAGIRWFAIVYFAVMALRYLVTMFLFPERRWLGGAIPIVFHWVLAAYLLLWSRFHREPGTAQ